MSFTYIQSSSLELQVLVDGLGSIWSSVEEGSRFSPGRGGGVVSWQPETVEIDLQTVGVQSNRTLTFVIGLAEGRQPGSASTEEYAALDNITLHPCIDCSAPGEKQSYILLNSRGSSSGGGGCMGKFPFPMQI